MKYTLPLVLLLTACASTPEQTVDQIDITKVIEPVEVLHPPLPQSITWEHYEITVLTPEIMRDLLKKYDAGKLTERDLVFAAVTPDGFEHLSLDIAELTRYIKDQKAVIMYYRETIPKDIFLPKENTKE